MFTPSVPVAYILICVASVMFASQFVFQQRYSKTEGTTVSGSLRFSLYGAIIQIFLMLALSLAGKGSGLTGFNLPAAGICVLGAINNILCAFFCVKVFESADMTMFSIFMMLGGMTLPFIAGLLFFDEEPRITKFIAFALIAAALFLETGKASPVRGKTALYYAGLFISNGMSGVYAKLNQSLEQGADTNAYIIMTAAATVIICSAILLFKGTVKKESIAFLSPKSALLSIVPYIIISSAGSFTLLTALETLPASVQYPMSTGGTIVISALISLIRREKLKPLNFVAVAISVASAIIIAL